MQDRYNFDVDEAGGNLVPPNYRKPKYLAYIKTILSPLKWLHNAFFERYVDGDYLTNSWSSAINYTVGMFAKGYDKAIYLCIKDHHNISVYNTEYWLKINPSFIGAKDRVRFNSQKAIFEFALNTFFSRPFHNPPNQPPVFTNTINDIYITNNIIDTDSFFVGTDPVSTAVVGQGEDQLFYIGTESDINLNDNDYTIHYPISITPFNLTQIEFEKQIEEFANRLNLAGLKFNIQGY